METGKRKRIRSPAEALRRIEGRGKMLLPVPGKKGKQATAEPAERASAAVSTDRKTTDDTAPIVVPDGVGIWTFGDHLRHLAGDAGTIPLALDEFGRCVIAVRRVFFTPNA